MHIPLLTRIEQIQAEAQATEPQMPVRPQAMDWYPSSQQAYMDRKREYRAAHRQWQATTLAKIEAAVAEEYGLTNHPKRQLLWEKAWEHGHASGLHEVLLTYDSLSDLLQADTQEKKGYNYDRNHEMLGAVDQGRAGTGL